MKKKLSLILAIVLVVSLLPTFMVANAASTTFGKTQTFEEETAFGGFDVVDSGDDEHGKVLKIEKGGSALKTAWQFDEQSSGQVLFSFDAYLSPDDKFFFMSGGDPNEGLMAFEKGVLRTTKITYQWQTYVVFGEKAVHYPTDEWFKFELIVDLDKCMEYYYINGEKVGEFTYDKNDEHAALVGQTPTTAQRNTFKKINNIAVYMDVEVEDSYIDNVLIRPLNSSSGEMSATVTPKDEIAVSFSDHIDDISEDAFSLEFIPAGTQDNMDINLALRTQSGTSAILVPEILEAGSYKLKMEGGVEGRWGQTFDSQEFSFVVEELAEEITTAPTAEVWTFDDSKLPIDPAGSWTILDDADTNRGKVLRFEGVDKKATMPLQTTWRITSGDTRKFIYSVDMFVADGTNHTTGDYLHFGALDGGVVQDIALYTGNKTLGKGIGYGWDAKNLGACKTGTWERVDILMDGATKKAKLYLDGKYLAEYSLANDVGGGAFDGFDRLWIWDQVKNDRSKIDNVMFKEYTGKYNADMKIDADGNIVLTFDETTMLTTNDVKLYVAADAMLNYEERTFEIAYQNGTKAILTPTDEFDPNEIVKVKVNASSAFGATPLKNEFVAIAPTIIGDIKFFNAAGQESQEGAADTTKITILFPAGLQGGVSGADIVFLQEIEGVEEDVEYVTTYNATDKILTITIGDGVTPKLLGSNGVFALIVNGVNAEGDDYDEVIREFTTGSGEFEISRLRISKTGSTAKIKLNFVNSTEQTGTYYVVFAGYQGDLLKVMEVEELVVTENGVAHDKTYTFTDAKIASCDKISAYIWNGFDSIVPVMRSIIR